jgi:hypothetical protein
MTDTNTIIIRRATDRDTEALRRLAALDSRPVPAGHVVLAFVDDELRAALPVHEGEPVADPFRPTAGLVGLLRDHVTRSHPAPRRRVWLAPILRPRIA